MRIHTLYYYRLRWTDDTYILLGGACLCLFFFVLVSSARYSRLLPARRFRVDPSFITPFTRTRDELHLLRCWAILSHVCLISFFFSVLSARYSSLLPVRRVNHLSWAARVTPAWVRVNRVCSFVYQGCSKRGSSSSFLLLFSFVSALLATTTGTEGTG